MFKDGKVKLVQDLPFQKIIPPRKEVFPLVIVPSSEGSFTSFDELKDYLQDHKSYIRKLIKVHGAVLFRGFNAVKSAIEFNNFIEEGLDFTALPYIGGAAVRTNVYKGVHTSNESPPSELIPYHHELAQAKKYPSHIFFYSDICAAEGGETPILRSDYLYSRLNPEFRDNLKKKGLQYFRVLPKFDDPTSSIGRGWRSTYNIPFDKDASEKDAQRKADIEKCEQVAQTLNYKLEWLPNGDVKTISNVLDGIKFYNRPVSMDSEDSETVGVFFNSMVAAYVGWRDSRNIPSKAVKYGDGSLIDENDIKQVVKIMDEIEVAFKWEKNDVLCIDNNQVMHSRRTFKPPRKVLAYVAV